MRGSSSRRSLLRLAALWGLSVAAGCTDAAPGSKDAPIEILNVSYDATGALYEDIGIAFARTWHDKTGQSVIVRRSHGGSGKQARAVIDGLEADVVTLGLGFDIDAIARNGRVRPDWSSRLPSRGSPFTSIIVFLVRKGNPRGIRDWPDLLQPGLGVITPNPKTSGGARWNYLAALGFAREKSGGDPAQAEDFVRRLYANVPVLDTSARGSMTTFLARGIGDVLIAWENEALYASRAIDPGQYEVIVPSASILAETPVAVVDAVVDKRRTREVAEAYLNFLYGDEGQAIAGAHYFRPRLAGARAARRDLFADVRLYSIDDFGGWEKAQREHFGDGGSFDRIFEVRR